MKISITGTPCVGKSIVSEILSKELGYKLIRVNDLAEKYNAYRGYDRRLQSKILDIGKLKKEVKKIKENVILDGHISHELPVDMVIILRCDPEILEKRLKKKYPKNLIKVKENVDAEILGVMTSESVQRNKNVFEIDTTKMKPLEIVERILSIIKTKNKKYKAGKIDWLEKYEKKLQRSNKTFVR